MKNSSSAQPPSPHLHHQSPAQLLRYLIETLACSGFCWLRHDGFTLLPFEFVWKQTADKCHIVPAAVEGTMLFGRTLLFTCLSRYFSSRDQFNLPMATIMRCFYCTTSKGPY